jgi:hypothetical protein
MSNFIDFVNGLHVVPIRVDNALGVEKPRGLLEGKGVSGMRGSVYITCLKGFS